MRDVIEIIKIDIDQIAEIREYHLVVEYNVDRITKDRPRYDQNYRNDFRRGNFRGNLRPNQTYGASTNRERIRCFKCREI